MKKRIWNQLKKAVVVTVLAGIMGNCTVSAAEFEAQELAAPEVLLQQSAEWTDEKNFQAEIRLEVSGLKELYKKTQDVDKGENVQEEKPAESEIENEASDGESDESEANNGEPNGEENEENTADGTEEVVNEASENESADQATANHRCFIITHMFSPVCAAKRRRQTILNSMAYI